MIRAIVGAGGKTSLLKRYAKEYLEQGYKVFVTTSTHMQIEEETLLTDDAEEILRELEKKRYVMAGRRTGEKMGPLSMETYKKICPYADVVLIEADGSNHRPVKFPREDEPVIYENVEEIVVVCGMHALQKRISEAAHRLELVKRCLQVEEDERITASQIQKLVMKGYVEPMRTQYDDKKIRVKPMGASSLYQRAAAKMMEAEWDVSVLKEEWFVPQPSLIICGAGHVSCDLVKMAACLDFYIKVIDDREEFVCSERFAAAQEQICDTFEHLERYLEPNAYYVVVTRGHKDDFACVRTVLEHSYEYLGMIGSRGKVKALTENLRKAGVSEEQIQTVFAPIGLKIGAVTPAEIAVSILGQVIQEKNKRNRASVSRELLECKESGTLCVVVGKSGSAPRGEGSMMFVTDDRVIDTIGGGAIEFAAVNDARACSEVMLKDYHLDQEKGAELGMICGGSNQVLFLPLEAVEG